MVLTQWTGGLRVAAYRSCGEPTGGSGVGIAKAESVAQERGRPVEPAPDNAGEGSHQRGGHFYEVATFPSRVIRSVHEVVSLII
jgi:hypothetical protein